MPATTVKGGKVKGEGRVISINAKYGFLAAQGINSKVFIIPSSLKLEAPFPPLTDQLHVDDLVTFEAIEQAERNGARYLAVDGSVKLKQRGKDVMFEGDGKIVRLDNIRGCFGFIDSADVGSVFFNISAVRPSTTDVTKVLKTGQKVKFRALPNLEQPNCKWRASIVCAAGKANEFLHARTVATTTTTTSIGTPASTNGGLTLANHQTSTTNQNNHHVVHRSGSADTRPKSSSFCSSSYASSENIAVASSPDFNSSFNDNNFDLTHQYHNHNVINHQTSLPNVMSQLQQQPAVVESFVSSSLTNYSNSNDLLRSTTSYLNSNESSSLTMNGTAVSDGGFNVVGDPVVVCNGGGKSSTNSNSSYDTAASTTATSTLENNHCCNNFGVVGEASNGGIGGMKGYQQKNQINNHIVVGVNHNQHQNNLLCSSSSWPITSAYGVDSSINPAAMWDLYLEQQQKALRQNFNPF